MERLSDGPHSRGDKTFSRFRKSGLQHLKRKVKYMFPNQNKMERLSNGPHTESAFAEFLPGIYWFQRKNKKHIDLKDILIYPPMGYAEQIQYGYNCFYLYIIWVRKGILTFRFGDGNPAF